MKRAFTGICLALLACQVAGRSSADQPKPRDPEKAGVRLPERDSRNAPRVLSTTYPIDERELCPELLQDKQSWQPAIAGAEEAGDSAVAALRVSTSTVRKLDARALAPRRAYRLAFSARLLGSGDASVGIRFREAKNRSFRTFRERVTSSSAGPHQLEFTAPAFVGNAELFIELNHTALELSALSLRMRAPLPTTVPISSWAGSYVPEGYGLVFNDEFEGTELDRRKWFTRFVYDSETQDHLNKENQRYRDDGNHRVAGGVLALTAKRLRLSQPSGANYESGMIRSDFTLTYGFFEARVKMPRGLGAWPAFWLNSDVSESGRLSWPPEIDIFEFVNNGQEDKPNQIHISTTNPPGTKTQFLYTHPDFRTSIKDYFAPFAFDAGWHTIGAEWTPADVTVFVDGLKVVTTQFEWKYADGSPAGPAHVLLNLAIGDAWAGRHGIDDSAFPQALSVDWVRVYQKT